MSSFRPSRGVSLVDVLVGSALILIVFLGLFAIIRASLAVTTLARLKSTATTITETNLEYIRSLPYGSIGTVGGIPAGIIPQYATTTPDGAVEFVTRTFIEYADDPADGLGASDTNGVTTDYKHVKVETSYVGNGSARTVTLVTNAAPPGIETTTGGGTLQATVVDAVGQPIAGASVRIVNSSITPAVDVTTFSSVAGVVYLGGAATSTDYEVYVSKSGYSSAQTYARDATNPNPSPGYLTVAADQTTASTFAIDVLASFTLRTFSPIVSTTAADTFADASGIISSSNTQVTGGALTLSGAPGSYPASGEAWASSTMPSFLAAWEEADAALDVPPGTEIRIHVTDSAGVLVPDATLPGNNTGFTGPIDLSSISTTTYPALALKASLISADPNVTPGVLEWSFAYEAGPMPLADVPFTLTGAKTIGSTALGGPIYKTVVATTTDASGVQTLSLEWDLYTISYPSHTPLSEDPASPYELLPGSALEARSVLSP